MSVAARLRVKPGVEFSGLDPIMVEAAAVVCGCYGTLGVSECWITSGTEGSHSERSLHFPRNSPNGKGRALDFRTKNVPRALLSTLAERVRSVLAEVFGARVFDVVVEHAGEANEHMHVECDPKPVAPRA